MSSLYTDVRRGIVRVTLVVAPPRTNSTAIGLTIAQSPDVDLYIHEPFANKYGTAPSIEAGNRIIGSALERLKAGRHPTPKAPIHVLVKEMSTCLSPRHFSRLSSICETVIVVVRCPLLQLASVARMCKWVCAGCPERYRFDIGTLREAARRRFCGADDLDYYVTRPWRATDRHVAHLSRRPRAAAGHLPRWGVVDGEVFRADPRGSLRRVATLARVRYSEGMLSGWTKEKSVNLKVDGWSARAARARRLHVPERRSPLIEEFPPTWERRILGALDVYLRLLATDRLVSPRSLSALRRLLAVPAGGRAVFGNARPVTSYAVACTLPGPPGKNRRLLLDIRRRSPHETRIFDSIDDLVGIKKRTADTAPHAAAERSRSSRARRRDR